jgi:OOP family OmpA-OmpF porin
MKLNNIISFAVAMLLCLGTVQAQQPGATYFGINRLHVQDYGFFRQYASDTCNCGESLPLMDRSNASIGLSVMRLYRIWGFSGDLGMGYGKVGLKSASLENTPKRWLGTFRADAYLYPVMTGFAIKPYLFTAAHVNGNNKRLYASVPVGVGVRYQKENVLITLQHGVSVFTDAVSTRNSVTSLGMYVPVKGAKKAEAPAPLPVPVKDSDNDGIVDSLDKCPLVPGDIANLGCPLYVKKEQEPDNDKDKDGVLDAFDKCPDVYGVVANNGCPVKDTDGDGVPDHIDVCPEVKGPASNGGCPVVETPATPVNHEVIGNVYFAVDKYELTPAAKDTLNKATRILKSKPNSVIELVGHTDSDGNHDYNVRLSKNRATAAKNYLITKGIAANRISISYHGMDKPAVNNTNADNKQMNRRVELMLVEQ